MIPNIVEKLTSFIDIRLVFGLVMALLILDMLDIFSDTSRRIDLIIRTLVLVGAGYLIISAGLPLL